MNNEIVNQHSCMLHKQWRNKGVGWVPRKNFGEIFQRQRKKWGTKERIEGRRKKRRKRKGEKKGTERKKGKSQNFDVERFFEG